KNDPQRSNVSSKSSASAAVEDSEEGVGGGARAREGSTPTAEESSTGSRDAQLPKPAPPPPKDTKTRRGDGDDRDESVSASEPPRNEVDRGTSTAAGFRVPTERDGGHHRSTAKPVPRGLTDEETRQGGTGEGQWRRGESGGGGGAVTTVTLTIVGGRPAGRGFTNLEQSGKTPSETVARFIALQAAKEGSELLSG
ncbi:unnamed protein product, partial [Ectocarpus sp. 12 AP-2014]